MTREDYEQYKKELLRRKTYPYLFANEQLANEFFEMFRTEVPTARMYKWGRDQFITHDWRAEKRLANFLRGKENDYMRARLAVADVRIDVENSIRSRQTRLTK